MWIAKGTLIGIVCFIPVSITYWIILVHSWHLPSNSAIGVDVVKIYTIQAPLFWDLFAATILLACYFVKSRQKE
ncbi:MAG: hypothetical protein ACRD5R_06650 [Candidatus Acidiferrales bacterium]